MRFCLLTLFALTQLAFAKNFDESLSKAACNEGLKCAEVSLLCWEGRDCYYGFQGAQAKCKKNGGRLPTLKELMFKLASMSDGRGLAPASATPPTYTPVQSSDSHVKSQKEYQLIEYKTSAGKTDKFYYSRDGFKGDGFGQPFWSDAVDNNDCRRNGVTIGCAVQGDLMGTYPNYIYKDGWARLACVFPTKQ